MEPLIFKEQLAQALKENISMDIRFNENNNFFEIDIYFDKTQIASENVYLDHKHELI